MLLPSILNKQGPLVEKTSRNSLKLTETLSELEAALQAWDRTEGAPPTEGEIVNDEPRKRAQALIEDLKLQLAKLSDL